MSTSRSFPLATREEAIREIDTDWHSRTDCRVIRACNNYRGRFFRLIDQTGAPAMLSGDFVYSTDEAQITPGSDAFEILSGQYTYSIDIPPLGVQTAMAAINPAISAIVVQAFPSGNAVQLLAHLNNEFLVSVDTVALFPANMLPAGYTIAGGYVDSQSDHDNNPQRSYHVIDTTPPTLPLSAVPETATWAMMIAGLGLISGTMRRAYRKSEDDFNAQVKAIAALNACID